MAGPKRKKKATRQPATARQRKSTRLVEQVEEKQVVEEDEERQVEGLVE